MFWYAANWITSSLNLYIYFVQAKVALLSPLFLKVSVVCLGLSQIDNYLLERDDFFWKLSKVCKTETSAGVQICSTKDPWWLFIHDCLHIHVTVELQNIQLLCDGDMAAALFASAGHILFRPIGLLIAFSRN